MERKFGTAPKLNLRRRFSASILRKTIRFCRLLDVNESQNVALPFEATMSGKQRQATTQSEGRRSRVTATPAVTLSHAASAPDPTRWIFDLPERRNVDRREAGAASISGRDHRQLFAPAL